MTGVTESHVVHYAIPNPFLLNKTQSLHQKLHIKAGTLVKVAPLYQRFKVYQQVLLNKY